MLLYILRKGRGVEVSPGKKPKERDVYLLRIKNGILVEVTREVYLEWYQSKRREKYQVERKQKYGVISLEAMMENGTIPIPQQYAGDIPESIVIKNILMEKLGAEMKALPKTDVLLIGLLFFENATVREAAEFFGCTQKTIHNRKKRILAKLYDAMESLGYEGI